MRSIKFLITAVVSLAILSGCQTNENGQQDLTSHPLVKAVSDQLMVKRDVQIFATAEEKDNQITVTITLHNIDHKAVTSAQTWLTYNPRHLKGLSIKTENSPFELTAPYENNFDEDFGLVRIGRASAKPLTDARIDVAQIVFEKQTDTTTMLNFYDYQTYLTGHTSVNMVLNGKPHNVLKQPVSPAVVIR